MRHRRMLICPSPPTLWMCFHASKPALHVLEYPRVHLLMYTRISIRASGESEKGLCLQQASLPSAITRPSPAGREEPFALFLHCTELFKGRPVADSKGSVHKDEPFLRAPVSLHNAAKPTARAQQTGMCCGIWS
ncbi:unnamed protein product [Caretta caretta]